MPFSHRFFCLHFVPLLFLAIALAGCGAPQKVEPLAKPLAPAPPPDYSVGDEFVYSIGGGSMEDIHRVVSVGEKNVIFQSSRVFGTITQPKAFSNPINYTGGTFAPFYEVTLTTDLAGLFPLEVGKSVSGVGSGRFNTGTVSVAYGCDVVRQERIVVRAGAFDSFVVDCRMQPERGPVARTVYWYAPEVGHFAAASRPGGHFHELARYTRAPR
ncbi:MAG: hypothetical protein ING02_05980 [Roseomonas sp.]|nr:hypothetical protein [Roseomonas sp.]